MPSLRQTWFTPPQSLFVQHWLRGTPEPWHAFRSSAQRQEPLSQVSPAP